MQIMQALQSESGARVGLLSIILPILIVAVVVYYIYYIYLEKKKIRETIAKLATGTISISTDEFFALRNKSFGGQGTPLYSNNFCFNGIYILSNRDKNMYYVGQGKDVMQRVNSHLTGKGNGDVYADYKYGDRFRVKMISLNNSGFSSLNDLERYMIEFYDSYHNGYNRTRGNN